MDSEFTLIDQAFRSGKQYHWPGTLVSNGDDASVHACEPGNAWVVSTDTAVVGVHWPDNFPLEQAADKAVCAALSDLAAMGAEARLVWVGVVAPDAEKLYQIGNGVRRAVERFDLELAGGDTVRAGLTVLNVTVAGLVPQDGAMRRNAAEVGDDVWLAGRIGFSAMGLDAWLHGQRDTDAVVPFFSVEPKLTTGALLRMRGVRCCIDISDGLVQDASHIAEASGLAMHLNLERCEGWAKLVEICGQDRGIAMALGGGEDYALLFTAPKQLRTSLDGLANRIGDCRSGTGVSVYLVGSILPVPARGYDHFALDGMY